MGSTIVRQWHLLTLLPTGPRRVDSATLEERLRARGLDAHRRTIQRDLVELAAIFPIVSDERSKPYGWRWADDAELLCAIPSLPGARVGLPEIDLVLDVRAAAVEAILGELRRAEGQARKVCVAPHHVGGAVAHRNVAPGDHTVVEARVPDGCALRRWLFGFADAVEVVAPAHLRAELAERAARIASIYGNAP